MRTGLASAMLALMLTACGGGSGATGNGAVADATADPMEARIDALNEGQRKTAFYHAIYDADFQCDEIVKIVDRPRDDGHRAWIATCGDTGDYYITLRPGGVFTVSGTPQTKSRLPKGTKILPAGTK
jgi:hypothetical protein